MKYTLTTLSPIHIGNGDQISNWSYGYDEKEKLISVYDFDKVVKALKNNPQRLLNLSAEIERNPLNKSLGKILKNYNLNLNPEYKIKIRGEIKNRRYKHIWEFIKENGKVYIPGTEIKGAIRTALFYKILKDKFKENTKLKEQFLKEYEKCLDVKNYRDDKDRKKQIQKKFSNLEKRWESIVFRAGFEKVFDKEFKFEDAKKDILKILLISDSNFKNPEEVLEVKDITPIGVSKKFKDLHEIVKTSSKFYIDMRIPFQNEYKEIFPETYKYLGMKKLREACSDFAISLLEADIEYLKKTEELEPKIKSEIIKRLEQRKEIAQIAIETQDPQKKYFLLRLGKHQGFLSTTINLLVKELDSDLYSKAYKYLVHIGYPEFPNKSRKITIDNELLGWCVLIPKTT
ncbi:MAG: type III-A CRISPR-associated RAMP protein Csm5 [Aquificae bacterium]|nr:type III-A CRISPR-associated RAMP protein Csm5 [Aquificota bacterium]